MISLRAPRPGVTIIELIVALGVVLIVLLGVLAWLPAAREQGRRTSCLRNLQQIGVGLALFDTVTGRLPRVPNDRAGTAPLPAILAQLGLTEFAAIDASAPRSAQTPIPPPAPRMMLDLICPADTAASTRGFVAPVSYRANTGETVHGGDGPFAPGRTLSLAQVNSADGTEFTIGFAERLVGTNSPTPDPANYTLVADQLASGCGPSNDWHGDAGSDWSALGWVSTLYNHALRPNQSPSCIAADGHSARIGSSSAHPDGVHVLWLDGRAGPIRSSIDQAVWQSLATVGSPAPTP